MKDAIILETNSQEWDARYINGETPWDTGRASSELMEVVHQQRVTPCNTLELGCGTGADSVFLAASGFEVNAVDCSVAAIDRAIARADAAQVRARFRWADVLDLPADLKHPYEFVFDRRCYEHLHEQHREGYLATVEHITQAGSSFLLLAKRAEADAEWFRSQQDGDESPGMSKDQITRDFGSLFEFSWIRPFRFDGHESQPRPRGWSCLMTRV